MGLLRGAKTGAVISLALAFVAQASSAAAADQARNSEWWLQALHVTTAWQSSRGTGVTVAVLDTGASPTQADLAGTVTTGPDFSQSGRVAGGQFWGVHGTAVASLIAGHGHGPGNADGIVGIAPAAKILAVRVTLESNDPRLASATVASRLPDAIAQGIRYAVMHGAGVIDLPLDPVTTPGAAGAGGSKAERSAVAYALSRGVVLVAPAGDGGAGADAVNYPAAYHGVISVGAFDSGFKKAPFSSGQPYVTLTAPGQGVTAATLPSGYTTLNSTSAASAVVAGVVALIKAPFPNLTPAQVTRALAAGTGFRPSGSKSGSGFGTVDAAKALTAAAAIFEALPSTTPSAGTGTSSGLAPPSPPAVRPASSNLARTLITDAGIAVVVFLVLLAAILAIGALRRRRARSARLAEVRAAAQVQAKRPAEPALPARGASGFVPAPVAAARPGSASGAGFGQAGLAGAQDPAKPEGAFPDSAFPEGTRTGGTFSGNPFPRTAPSAAEEPPGGYRPAFPGGGSGSERFAGSSRIGAVRAPKVSGSPPWEPAPKPGTELPWTQQTVQPSATGPKELPQRLSQRPGSRPWDALAEEAWPGGPATAGPHPPAAAPAQPGSRAASRRGGMVPPSGSAAGDSRPRLEQPIYVWDPGTTPGSRGQGAAPGPPHSTPPWEVMHSLPEAEAESTGSAGLAGAEEPAEPSLHPSPGEASGSFRPAPLAGLDDSFPATAGNTAGPFATGTGAGADPNPRAYTDDSFSIPGESSGERSPAMGAGADANPRAYTDDSFSIPGESSGELFSTGADSYPRAYADDSFSVPGGSTAGAFGVPAGHDTGSPPGGPTGESTETFTAISSDDTGQFPATPHNESTETFPAVPPREAGKNPRGS